jgi:DNA-binding transcriptional MerR regulator
MTKDEALKMAIEALEKSLDYIEEETIESIYIRQSLGYSINACKEALERPSNMVAVPLDKLEDMQRRLNDCEEYLKEDETPAECIARNRKDTNTTLKLLAKCMGEKKALEQPTVAELNDEYLRDFYVEGLNQPAQFCKHGLPRGVCTLGEKDCE